MSRHALADPETTEEPEEQTEGAGMTEADLLRLAGEYRKARILTDQAARFGLNALSALQVQGVTPDIIDAALTAHLGPFRTAIALEATALAAVLQARNA